jgi:hypothetical protein
MAPRTSTSRKRDRRKMMREAEMRRQQQQQQQQQQLPVELSSSTCDAAASTTMTLDDVAAEIAIAGIRFTDTATHQSISREILEEEQNHVMNQSHHPPDCRCILRKLARDDLFLPYSMKNKAIDEADGKA